MRRLYQKLGPAVTASVVAAVVILCSLFNFNWQIRSDLRGGREDSAQSHLELVEKMGRLLTAELVGTMSVLLAVVVTERKKEKKRLVLMKNAYHTALSKSSDLFFEVDLSADRLKIHSCRVEGVWEQRDLPYSEIVSCSAKKCAPQFQEAFAKTFSLEYIWDAIKKSIPSVCFEYEAAVKEEERWYSATLVPVFTGDKASARLFCMERDITELKQQQIKLKTSAMLDGSTGLYNKKTSEHMIRQRLGKQSEGQKYALFMIDIDDFKAINDSYGHMEGDAVIAQTALQLKKLFSPADITGRFGGDEFIVFFDEISYRKEIEEKAEKIKEMLRSAGMNVSFSVGIAVSEGRNMTFEVLYKKADSALYATKQRGKDGYTIYTMSEV